FAETVMIDGFFWDTWYRTAQPNDKPVSDDDNKILYENKLLGLPRLRQVRVRPDSCTIYEDFQRSFETCYAGYSTSAEDHTHFGPGDSKASDFTPEEADRFLEVYGIEDEDAIIDRDEARRLLEDMEGKTNEEIMDEIADIEEELPPDFYELRTRVDHIEDILKDFMPKMVQLMRIIEDVYQEEQEEMRKKKKKAKNTTEIIRNTNKEKFSKRKKFHFITSSLFFWKLMNAKTMNIYQILFVISQYKFIYFKSNLRKKNSLNYFTIKWTTPWKKKVLVLGYQMLSKPVRKTKRNTFTFFKDKECNSFDLEETND
ncbi:Uncharacterized protein GBIM_18344, partial [Gryllus bimaculatus]